ncbi:thiol:disulfide interchange protein DsbA/DsbL [Nevskia ramosa]|uniref:thiol:disulfide interchange protein DsbA/DsbL n=1 Tax=Nevskia ramosa TaxID=64002 RepID=UPI00235447B1|nr:thiol:disulfide interchange protein DsbA/DsbL [Nevskia ramosa]
MRTLKNFVAGGLLATLALFSVACSAADSTPSGDFQLGRDYTEVPSPQKPADPKRITVEEFFWYGCPHCFALEPTVEAWLKTKPADVDFIRVPNTLGRPEGEVHARAFYIAQTLGILDKTHKPLFAAIHEQHQQMASLEAIRELYVAVAGIKPADFDGIAASFVVDSGMRRGEALARTYVIRSVPILIVGGTYAVPGSPTAAKTVDFLVDKIRKSRK